MYARSNHELAAHCSRALSHTHLGHAAPEKATLVWFDCMFGPARPGPDPLSSAMEATKYRLSSGGSDNQTTSVSVTSHLVSKNRIYLAAAFLVTQQQQQLVVYVKPNVVVKDRFSAIVDLDLFLANETGNFLRAHTNTSSAGIKIDVISFFLLPNSWLTCLIALGRTDG